MTILDVMDHEELLGRFFRGPSWDAWRAFLCALFALPMTEAQLTISIGGIRTAPIRRCFPLARHGAAADGAPGSQLSRH